MSRAAAIFIGIIALSLTAPMALSAQGSAPKPRHPVVCANGVRIYNDRAQLPAKRDSLTLPPSQPVRVNSPEEAEAAEMALRGRAGAIGATSLLISDETTDDGTGGQQVARRVAAFFVPADSAAAQKACGK
jgi:hypothetical protein